MISRSEKEHFLKQKAFAIWITGLSGSGKTVLAENIEKALLQRNILATILDGDILRQGINSDLGYTIIDREENIRRAAEIAKLFIDCGIICICSFISPSHKIRKIAKDIIRPKDFIEIYLDTPLEVCEKRDAKGLYKSAREGKILDFTGIQLPYEIPINPDILINTELHNEEQCLQMSIKLILRKLTTPPE